MIVQIITELIERRAQDAPTEPMPEPNYDTTLARIAGNIAGPLIAARINTLPETAAVAISVRMARAIMAEVQRAEPREKSHADEA
jgi:hypothetical protein